ncbi:response regulator [Skermanella sp. TT6]|uniref:histidine kinase n=1 Tax=Skermanella cutis TaxID=2775420 RepID=A0ABX7AZ20_9PROT|nr:hybrid sensor histidine kinase/response regulator [Skermanella sp. TT6]QQP87320.1 response regulator [Skermanella sp. TT6]
MDLLILMMAAFFALSLVGMRAVWLWSEYDRELARAESASRDLARMTEEYIDRVFEASDLIALEVVRYVRQKGGVEQIRHRLEPHRYLADLARRIIGLQIFVVDRNGVPALLTTQFPAPSGDFTDRAWLKDHLAGADRHIGEALIGRFSGEILFTYSRAIRDSEGSLDGIAQISMRPTFFEQVPLTSDLGAGVQLMVWNLDGGVIARTGMAPQEIGRNYRDHSAFWSLLAGRSGTFRVQSPFDGGERIFSFRRHASWPVIVSASVPVSSALIPFRESLHQSVWQVALLLCGLAALTAVSLRMSRREAILREELAVSNDTLVRSGRQLEGQVEERTRELGVANDRMREEERRFRGIFNSMFQYITLLRPDGTVLEINRAALDFGGLSQADVIGMPFWETPWWRPDADAVDKLRQAITRAAGGEFVRYEAEITGVDDRRVLIDFSLKGVADEHGRTVLLVAEGRDISDLKAAQAKLHEAQKLELLGQLTGGVAHDFNNLLMVILSNLDLLRKRLPDDDRLRQFADSAIQAAERGTTLTQRLLAFARRQDLRPEVVDLRDLVGGMRDLVERSVGVGIRTVFDLPDGLPNVRVDANQLELALLNLVLNAKDAMREGGVLTISLRHQAADRDDSSQPRAGFVCLTVADNGCGMDDRTSRSCIEPFFTTKEPGKGSGLGLSMVHGLAVQSGGWLRILTQIGMGTRISIGLPAAGTVMPIKPLLSDAREEASAPPSCRVLLVEDDVLVGMGAEAVLQDMGHSVTLAHDGNHALEILDSAGPFDLIITDYAMPGMTGLDLIETLRSRYPDLPIVLASGYADLPNGAIPAGVARLCKPYRPPDLVAVLADLLGPGGPSNVIRFQRDPRAQ